jgi:hypothetical protein
MMVRPNKRYKDMVVMISIAIVIATFLIVQMIQADEAFDLKAMLLKHREQHTNHLSVRFMHSMQSLSISTIVHLLTFCFLFFVVIQKDFAYEHFRRLDRLRIEKMQALIADHERRLFEFGRLEEDEHRALIVTKERHSKLLSESLDEKQERYAELHEAMQSEHTLGLSDLDFTLTELN